MRSLLFHHLQHAVNSKLFIKQYTFTSLGSCSNLKTYSHDSVLKVITEEFQQQHDEGLTVLTSRGKLNVRSLLVQGVGDNLGMHSALGYAESFSRSNFACDLCLASQDDVQLCFAEK